MEELIGHLQHPHPNVVPSLRLATVHSKCGVVMPYIHGHTLEELMSWSDYGVASLAANVGLHVLQGLQYLHARRVLHLDVTPSNIMFNEQSNQFVLIDIDPCRTSFTPCYMSPDTSPCEQSDTWSTAAVLLHMLTGRMPWNQCTERVQVLAQLFAKHTPPELCCVCDVWLGAISCMMNLHYQHRPTACDIVCGKSAEGIAVLNLLLAECIDSDTTRTLATHAESSPSGSCTRTAL